MSFAWSAGKTGEKNSVLRKTLSPWPQTGKIARGWKQQRVNVMIHHYIYVLGIVNVGV